MPNTNLPMDRRRSKLSSRPMLNSRKTWTETLWELPSTSSEQYASPSGATSVLPEQQAGVLLGGRSLCPPSRATQQRVQR